MVYPGTSGCSSLCRLFPAASISQAEGEKNMYLLKVGIMGNTEMGQWSKYLAICKSANPVSFYPTQFPTRLTL